MNCYVGLTIVYLFAFNVSMRLKGVCGILIFTVTYRIAVVILSIRCKKKITVVVSKPGRNSLDMKSNFCAIY